MIGRVSEQYLGTFQDIVFALLEKDAEELTNAALTIGIAPKNLNKARLVEDVEIFVEKYTSVKDLARLDVSAAITDLIEIMNVHHVSMPGEYTMLLRSLVTIEGTMETLCPELDLFGFLAKKMLKRAREGLNLKESILSAVETLASSGRKAVRLPAMAFGILRNLSKGKLKINLELNGNDDFVRDLNALVKNSLLVVIAAVLFSGSVRLSAAGIQPQINGIPLVALLGFVAAAALTIYAFLRMTKLK
jgi:ubiquinone biosynthesis protein